MEAIANKNTELVRLLLEYDADLYVEDNDGNTPLSLARKCGVKDIEHLLLRQRKQ